jgi:transposase
MLDRLPREPLWVVGDKGYASNAFRDHVWTMGARPAIPPKRRDAAVACPQWVYRNRHLVENLWARLKEWRAVATRYEKTATSFLAILHLAAAADWIKI